MRRHLPWAPLAIAIAAAAAVSLAASFGPTASAAPQDVVVESQDFEGEAFPPAGWSVVDNLLSPARYQWNRETCEVEAGLGGAAGAWALGGGEGGAALTCGAPYTEAVDTTMYYGPFDTTGYPGGLRVSLRVWLDVPRIPDGEPFLVCATYGSGQQDFNCYGAGTQRTGWASFAPLDFPLATGRTDNIVWLTYFDRVPEGGHVGVFVDNIVIEGVGATAPTPSPSPTDVEETTNVFLPFLLRRS